MGRPPRARSGHGAFGRHGSQPTQSCELGHGVDMVVDAQVEAHVRARRHEDRGALTSPCVAARAFGCREDRDQPVGEVVAPPRPTLWPSP